MTEQELEVRRVDQGLPGPQTFPEYYTNAFNLAISAWDVILDYGIRGSTPLEFQTLFRQRMSLQHAWAMCKLLDKGLQHFIRTNGPITLPRHVLEELGLVEEYDAQTESMDGSDD